MEVEQIHWYFLFSRIQSRLSKAGSGFGTKLAGQIPQHSTAVFSSYPLSAHYPVVFPSYSIYPAISYL